MPTSSNTSTGDASTKLSSSFDEKSMALKVELNVEDIPTIFARFRDVVGERYWLDRVRQVKSEIKGHRFLKDYLMEQNATAFAFAECSELANRYGSIPMHEMHNRALYPAISFAAQTLSIIDESSVEQARKVLRRIHGAFRNPDDMRAIRMELLAATHFILRGNSITWPEMENSGRFDLLIDDIGTNGLEVECKSVSGDKGRKIHRRESLEFFHLIKPDLDRFGRNLQTGLAVILTLPDRLPTSYRERSPLAHRAMEAIVASQNLSLEDGVHIRVSEFDSKGIRDLEEAFRSGNPRGLIDSLTVTRNREAMFVSSRNGGGVIFVLQSQKDDSLMQYIFDKLGWSAENQVSKNRPALFLVGLDSVGEEELISVAAQDFDSQRRPTELRREVSKFLNNDNRDHIIGVGFLSSSELKPKSNGVIRSSGAAYTFPNRESRFWHPDFAELFEVVG